MNEYAYIHETDKGQILITLEYDENEDDHFVITLWVPMLEFHATAKLIIKIDNEQTAKKMFTNLKKFSTTRNVINQSLNQQYI